MNFSLVEGLTNLKTIHQDHHKILSSGFFSRTIAKWNLEGAMQSRILLSRATTEYTKALIVIGAHDELVLIQHSKKSRTLKL